MIEQNENKLLNQAHVPSASGLHFNGPQNARAAPRTLKRRRIEKPIGLLKIFERH